MISYQLKYTLSIKMLGTGVIKIRCSIFTFKVLKTSKCYRSLTRRQVTH